MIHLDTSFLIKALVRDSPEDKRLRGWLMRGESVGLSALAWAEFLCGPLSSDALDTAELVVGEPEPFTHDDAILAASFFNNSERRRGALLDCMIAASAVLRDAHLATSNTADFQRMVRLGLKLA